MEAQEFRQGLSDILDEAESYGFEQEAAIEAAGKKILGRLFALVQKGYRPDLDETFSGAISRNHPSKRCRHPMLYFYSDGLVVSPGKSDEFRFGRDGDEQFQKFLGSISQPSLWDKTRAWRTDFAAWMFIALVCGGPALLVYLVMSHFGH
jgi:hypothetical protein